MSALALGALPSVLQLRPQLWLDFDAGTIIRGRQAIYLTAQEAKIVTMLAQSMRVSRGYLRAEALAERLHLAPEADGPHCVEGAISNIRRKLGEPKRSPAILICRKGFGYRLIGMEPSHPIPVSAPGATVGLELVRMDRMEQMDRMAGDISLAPVHWPPS